MKWTEGKVTSPAGGGPVSRSSHGVSVIGDTLYLWGGEHEARTPVDTNMWAVDLKKEGSMEWRVVPSKREPPSQRSGLTILVIKRNFVYLLIVGLVMVNVLLMEMCTYLEAGLGLL